MICKVLSAWLHASVNKRKSAEAEKKHDLFVYLGSGSMYADVVDIAHDHMDYIDNPSCLT
eukprot:m.42795 g.42795  ORF g.42795 m.42795 type:complete len:60 (-) comp11975_c0_seq1:340-519(-)